MYNTIERKTDRQERIPHFSQEAIRDTKIAVIGAGATGNEVLKCLALTGLRDVYKRQMFILGLTYDFCVSKLWCLCL